MDVAVHRDFFAIVTPASGNPLSSGSQDRTINLRTDASEGRDLFQRMTADRLICVKTSPAHIVTRVTQLVNRHECQIGLARKPFQQSGKSPQTFCQRFDGFADVKRMKKHDDHWRGIMGHPCPEYGSPQSPEGAGRRRKMNR